jgi:colanic acid biosynthesis glycosyl transferase WcaI
MSARVWIVSELYHPEWISTGHFMTGIAESLSTSFDVHVICSHPTYAARGLKTSRHERRNGVEIFRCRATRSDPALLFGKLLNAVSVTISLAWNLLRRVRSNELVIIVTNPPMLPLLARIACSLRRARPVLLVHDVYPQALFAARMLRADSLAGRIADRAAVIVYRKFRHVVVLGRDMRDLVMTKGVDPRRISIIPNWAEVETIAPGNSAPGRSKMAIGGDQFVVQFMGNLGRTHDPEVLIRAAARVRGQSGIHFLIIGSGARRASVEAAAAQQPNVTFLPSVPEDELNLVLNAADLAVIPMASGMKGVSMPSRTYNALAAGLPIVALAEEGSELALLVREHEVGWVVPPGDVEALVEVIADAARNPGELARMSKNGRTAAEEKYSRQVVLGAWTQLVIDIESADSGAQKAR